MLHTFGVQVGFNVGGLNNYQYYLGVACHRYSNYNICPKNLFSLLKGRPYARDVVFRGGVSSFRLRGSLGLAVSSFFGFRTHRVCWLLASKTLQTCACVCVCVSVCLQKTYICICVCVCVCMYVCMYVYGELPVWLNPERNYSGDCR